MKRLGGVENKGMKRGKLVFQVYIFLILSAFAFSESFTLQFSVTIEIESADVFPDSFSAVGKTASEPNTLINSSLLQPPPPPARSYVQIREIELSPAYLQAQKMYEPNTIDLVYAATLFAFDANSVGLSGNCVLQLENPQALEDLPGGSLVYLRRFDSAGMFAESYDLSDPANHTIEWTVTDASGDYAEIDLIIVNLCRAADLIVDKRINLEDFAALSDIWKQTGPTIVGDIFLDEEVNLKDLSLLVETWLCSCLE